MDEVIGTVEGIVLYVILWWLTLFAVLPWGVHVPDKQESGHADSAPSRPRMGLKVAVTSAVAAVLWVIVYFMIDAGVVNFRE